MKRQVRRLMLVLILATLFSGWASITPPKTITWAEQPLLTREQNALKSFDRNYYNKVIDLARGQDSDPNGNGPLFIYYSHV